MEGSDFLSRVFRVCLQETGFSVDLHAGAQLVIQKVICGIIIALKYHLAESIVKLFLKYLKLDKLQCVSVLFKPECNHIKSCVLWKLSNFVVLSLDSFVFNRQSFVLWY